MKKKLSLVIVTLFTIFSVMTPIRIKAAEQKKVVTTFYPVYYLAQQIAGDKMEVSMLLDGGQGAHDYESTAKDLAKVQGADLFIYQDDEMEFFVADMLKSIDQNKTKVLESTKDIELLAGSDHGAHEHEEGEEEHADESHEHEEGEEEHADESHEHEEGEEEHADESHEHEEGEEEHADESHEHEEGGEEHADESHEHEEGEEEHADESHEHEEGHEGHHHEEGEEGHHHEFDPHTWLDPLVYAQQAENVKNMLIEIDPDNKETYEQNAKKLEEELTKLDSEYKEELKDLDNRTIVVQHAAFGYLTHAYDLEQVAITGLNTTQEPSAQVIADMQKFMEEKGNKVIYVDPSISSDVSKTVGDATGAELLPFRTLEVVTPDEIKDGVDYFSLMRENLKQLVNNK